MLLKSILICSLAGLVALSSAGKVGSRCPIVQQQERLQTQWEVSPEEQSFVDFGLSSGASDHLNRVDTSFTCVGRDYAYYADVANDCRVYHICQPYLSAEGVEEMRHSSFLCAPGTKFDQSLAACTFETEAMACGSSEALFEETARRFAEPAPARREYIDHAGVDHFDQQKVAVQGTWDEPQVQVVQQKTVVYEEPQLPVVQEKTEVIQPVKGRHTVIRQPTAAKGRQVVQKAIALKPTKTVARLAVQVKEDCLVYDTCPIVQEEAIVQEHIAQVIYPKKGGDLHHQQLDTSLGGIASLSFPSAAGAEPEPPALEAVYPPASPEASRLGLPHGADQILGLGRAIDTRFSCQGKGYGYYADMANECKVYHICQETIDVDHEPIMSQMSFFCPATTHFDQEKLGCIASELAMPCEQSGHLYAATAERFAAPPATVVRAAAAEYGAYAKGGRVEEVAYAKGGRVEQVKAKQVFYHKAIQAGKGL